MRDEPDVPPRREAKGGVLQRSLFVFTHNIMNFVISSTPPAALEKRSAFTEGGNYGIMNSCHGFMI